MRRLAMEHENWVDDDQYLDDKYIHLEACVWLGDVRTKKTEEHFYRRTMPMKEYLKFAYMVERDSELAMERWWFKEHWFPTFQVGEWVYTPWLAHDMPQFGRIVEIEKNIARVQLIPDGNPPGVFAFRFPLITLRPRAYGK